MIELDTARISEAAPYKVWLDNGEYIFKTDVGIVYAVGFKLDEVFQSFTAYWLDLANRSHKPSPNDLKVKDTLACIIEEFFRLNPDVLLYLCDTANGQQAMRNRLFMRWVNTYGMRQNYRVFNEVIPDEGEMNFVSLIIPRTHPQYMEIVSHFNEMINMFKADKP